MSTTSTSLLPIQQEVAVVIMQLVAFTLHFQFTCWMLDPKEYPRLDLMVDVADHGQCTDCQTVV